MVSSHCWAAVAPGGDTPLHLYARYGPADAADALLRQGADVEARNPQGLTPLLLAAQSNQLEVLQLLLCYGARTDARAPLPLDMDRRRRSKRQSRKAMPELGTCVHLAAAAGHALVLKLLVAAAALDVAVCTQGRRRLTPLHLAAQSGHVATVRVLLAARADVNCRDAQGLTPLHYVSMYPSRTPCSSAAAATLAASHQSLVDAAHVAVAQTLMDSGASLDACGALDGTPTPLKMALLHGHTTLANALAARGGHVSRSALWLQPFKTFFTLWSRRTSFVALKPTAPRPRSLSQTLAVDTPPLTTQKPLQSENCSSLHVAARRGQLERVQTLLAAGASPLERDDAGDTPMLTALRHGHSRTVQWLLQHVGDANEDGDVNAFDPRVTSALHVAAFFGSLELVKRLARDSNSLGELDATDADGATPLWLAAIHGHLDVVVFLAQQGADTHRCVAGDSAIRCAALLGHLDVVEYLSGSSPTRPSRGSRRSRVDRRRSI